LEENWKEVGVVAIDDGEGNGTEALFDVEGTYAEVGDDDELEEGNVEGYCVERRVEDGNDVKEEEEEDDDDDDDEKEEEEEEGYEVVL
jgi:hypothetical protein